MDDTKRSLYKKRHSLVRPGWHFFVDILRTALSYLKVPVRFQSISRSSVLFNIKFCAAEVMFCLVAFEQRDKGA